MYILLNHNFKNNGSQRIGEAWNLVKEALAQLSGCEGCSPVLRNLKSSLRGLLNGGDNSKSQNASFDKDGKSERKRCVTQASVAEDGKRTRKPLGILLLVRRIQCCVSGNAVSPAIQVLPESDAHDRMNSQGDGAFVVASSIP